MPNPVTELRILHARWGDVDDVRPALKRCLTFCPGCEMLHPFTIEVYDGYTGRGEGRPEPVWEWDGDTERPTFSPSMLAYSTVHLCEGEHEPEVCEDPGNCGSSGHLILNASPTPNVPLPEPEDRVLGHNTPHTRDPAWGNCHSFLRSGRWEFLTDSAHALAGQTVPMVPLPDWILR